MKRELLKAAVNGKIVQVLNGGTWIDLSLEGVVRHFLNGTTDLGESFTIPTYRIKPVPFVQWCAVLKSGQVTNGMTARNAAAKYSSCAKVLRLEMDADTFEVISAKTEAP